MGELLKKTLDFSHNYSNVLRLSIYNLKLMTICNYTLQVILTKWEFF